MGPDIQVAAEVVLLDLLKKYLEEHFGWNKVEPSITNNAISDFCCVKIWQILAAILNFAVSDCFWFCFLLYEP